MTPLELYRFDMKLASLGRRMTTAGFAFDSVRAMPMREHLVKLEAEAQQRASQAAGKELNLLSPLQLVEAFITRLKAPVLKRSEKTGGPSLDAEVMQQYAAFASPEVRELAAAVLAYRRARKLRSTYLDAPLELSQHDGRVHCNWNFYGTVSGRASSDSPNLQNMPRKAHDLTCTVEPGGIRSLYVAKPGCVLVSFDACQLEARIAAYWSGDPAMIAACESADFHASNAERLFPRDFKAEDYLTLAALSARTPEEKKQFAFLKKLRDDAKQAGFACNYLAEAPTLLGRLVAEGHKATLQQAEALLNVVRRTFHVYFKFQATELQKVASCGYVYAPLSQRRRFVGNEPIPSEAANFAIQGGAADLMNIRILELDSALQQRFPDARIVSQVHDAASIETAEVDAVAVAALCKDVLEAPIRIGSFTASFPIETKITEQWA